MFIVKNNLLIWAESLIQLVIQKCPAMVWRKPSLVGVTVASVGGPGQLFRVGPISDVHEGEGVLIVAPADLTAGVPRVKEDGPS